MHTTNSLEKILWVLLLFLAAALRLVSLGAAPLSSAEAVQALAAYQAAHGGGIPPQAQEISPFLFHANVLLFALFRGGDGLARLVPALCGVGLVLTPLLLRRYLGPWGALGSGLMLALSPTLLALSRTLDGAIPAALGVMLLVGAVARYLDSYRSAWIPLGGAGLALALTAGPAAWGLLLGLALALAAGLWLWREQIPWVWPMVRPALGRALLAFALGLFAFGAGLGLHPAGLAATGEQFIRWLALGAGQMHKINLALQILSEPLILLTGIAGAALALSRRHGMGLLWLFWAVVGIVGAGLAPALGGQPQGLPLQAPVSSVLWLVPLAGLGGLAVEALARAVYPHPTPSGFAATPSPLLTSGQERGGGSSEAAGGRVRKAEQIPGDVHSHISRTGSGARGLASTTRRMRRPSSNCRAMAAASGRGSGSGWVSRATTAALRGTDLSPPLACPSNPATMSGVMGVPRGTRSSAAARSAR